MARKKKTPIFSSAQASSGLLRVWLAFVLILLMFNRLVLNPQFHPNRVGSKP